MEFPKIKKIAATLVSDELVSVEPIKHYEPKCIVVKYVTDHEYKPLETGHAFGFGWYIVDHDLTIVYINSNEKRYRELWEEKRKK